MQDFVTLLLLLVDERLANVKFICTALCLNPSPSKVQIEQKNLTSKTVVITVQFSWRSYIFLVILAICSKFHFNTNLTFGVITHFAYEKLGQQSVNYATLFLFAPIPGNWLVTKFKFVLSKSSFNALKF